VTAKQRFCEQEWIVDDRSANAEYDPDDRWDLFAANISATEQLDLPVTEIDIYLWETDVSRCSMDDPLEYWRFHHPKWPTLGKMVRRFLAPPETSVLSERIFSTAGDVISDRRSMLTPQNAEMLLFLKQNLNKC